MVELRYLNLSTAYISGKLPPHLGNLTNLNALDLSFYKFYDTRWAELNDDIEWMSHLSSLQFLGFTGINFSETSNLMQVLSSLPLLSSLRMTHCSLQNIHFSLSSLNYSSFLTRIQLLDLSYNQLSGPTPKAFQNMTSLKFLYLSENKFTTIHGGLSSFIGNNCGLKVFDLSSNYDLGGSYENDSMNCKRYDLQVLNLGLTSLRTKIPDRLGRLKNLQSLYLCNSYIFGSIPASLGNLSNLEYLDLSNNALTGAIPTSFGRLLNLRRLYLSYNRMEEVRKECFIQLRNLEVLDISANLLKGVVTEAHFVNLSQLHTLYLGYNHLLSLNMEPNWVPPFQLKFLDASSCILHFGSEFPQWFQTQKTLIGLWLSNASISSALPTWLKAQNLTNLDLSHNQIVGSLPTNIVDQMPNLKELILNNNLINDSLPPSLFELQNLKNLDVSHNQIVGSLPTNLGNQMPNLTWLFLNDNLINDSLPSSLC